MLTALNKEEKEVMSLLIRGYNFNGISQWTGIDYNKYLFIKKSIFKKLHVTKTIQLLPFLLQNGLEYEF